MSSGTRLPEILPLEVNHDRSKLSGASLNKECDGTLDDLFDPSFAGMGQVPSVPLAPTEGKMSCLRGSQGRSRQLQQRLFKRGESQGYSRELSCARKYTETGAAVNGQRDRAANGHQPGCCEATHKERSGIFIARQMTGAEVLLDIRCN
jgi:hypothetical protein